MAQFGLSLLVSPDGDPWRCLLLNLAVHCACGYWVALTTLSATHHHPFNYHAGDEPHPSRDWGIQQLDSLRDVRKSHSLFLVATTFGDHLLHHFLPTVDHSKLHHLYPALQVRQIDKAAILLLFIVHYYIGTYFISRRP